MSLSKMFFDHTRDTAVPIMYEYDYIMVVISILVAIFASYTAFFVSERRRVKENSYKDPWLACGAVCLGLAIWSMHFLGMLAYKLPLAVSYDLSITYISVLPSILASFIVLHTHPGQNLSLLNLFIRSIIMGGGIGLMHYTGMGAMKMDAIMRYFPFYFYLSIVVAVVLSGVALKIRLMNFSRINDNLLYSRRILVASTVMGCAISGMHYTGMAAMVILPAEGNNYSTPFTSSDNLAWIIAGTTVLAGLLLLIAVEISYRLKVTSKFQAVLNTVTDAVIAISPEGIIELMNPAAEKIFGYKESEAKGKNVNILMPFPYHTEHDSYIKNYEKTGKGKVIGASRIVEAQRKNKEIFPIQLSVSPINNAEEPGYVGSIKDLSELKKQEGLLHAIFENMPNMMFVKEAKNLTFTRFNRAGEKILGMSREEVLGKSDKDLFPEEQADFFIKKDREVLQSNDAVSISEEPIETKHGKRILYTKKISIRDAGGVPQFLLGISEDITEQKLMQEELIYLAKYDQLTGLANRATAQEFLEQEVSRSQRSNKKIACLFLDLNNFKPINDSFSHAAGDSVLVEVGKRLKEQIRSSDCVSRIGGDEFLITFVDFQDMALVEEAKKRITKSLENPISSPWGTLSIGVSIGVSFYPEDASSPEELISIADKRMYLEKKEHRPIRR